MDVLELSDKLFTGEIEAPGSPSSEDPGADVGENPFSPRGELVEVAEGTAFVNAFANVSSFLTEDGLVDVDSGAPFSAAAIHGLIRGWSPQPRLDTAIFTHGHVDHVFGIGAFEEEARERGVEPPSLVGHESVPERFERYALTPGYNGAINSRQFGADVPWPTEYPDLDRTYRERLDLDIGGERFELHHARGETDDATWVWVPGRKVLCSGDLIIWCVPNAGNPQKVQRYAREWSVALREMAELGAEVLLPGHGLPVAGADRVSAVLTDTADLIDELHDQTVALMNEGASLDEVIHTVRAPEALLEKPYLRPIYDDPEFVVRNVWRLYGGWYDLDPANLKPAPAAELAGEVATLAGGTGKLAERALALAEEGNLRLAGHLAEMAWRADPDHPAARDARARVNVARTAAEPSLMAKSIFRAAAQEAAPEGDGSG